MPRISICLVRSRRNGKPALSEAWRFSERLRPLEPRSRRRVRFAARDNAERVAAQAEAEIGPQAARLQFDRDAAASDPAIDAFIVATEAFGPGIAVVPEILKAGKHVLCERPLALTVRSCRALTDAATQGKAMLLATAENCRRDPTDPGSPRQHSTPASLASPFS